MGAERAVLLRHRVFLAGGRLDERRGEVSWTGLRATTHVLSGKAFCLARRWLVADGGGCGLITAERSAAPRAPAMA